MGISSTGLVRSVVRNLSSLKGTIEILVGPGGQLASVISSRRATACTLLYPRNQRGEEHLLQNLIADVVSYCEPSIDHLVG